MTSADDVHIRLPRAALATIFDECDRYDHDETGGRVLGTYESARGNLELNVSGLIEAGPAAERSSVLFQQDGHHQEKIFRQIEREHPKIEHLGNWHTHHMNGLATLSGGDLATYHRTVNHSKHNVPFFYALLVVAKQRSSDPLERYSIKHFLFRRGDPREYQVPNKLVELMDTPLVWPVSAGTSAPREAPAHSKPAPVTAKPERVFDRDILGEFYPGMKPYRSPKLGVYWRGPIELADGTRTEVVVAEDSSTSEPSYTVLLRDLPEPLAPVAAQLGKHSFPSARLALITAERTLNHQLFDAGRRAKPRKWFS
jgi:hypothetical protein